MGALDAAGRTFVEELDAGHVPRDSLDGRAVQRGLRKRGSEAGRERVAVVAVSLRASPSRRVGRHDEQRVGPGRWRHLRGRQVWLCGDGEWRGGEEQQRREGEHGREARAARGAPKRARDGGVCRAALLSLSYK